MNTKLKLLSIILLGLASIPIYYSIIVKSSYSDFLPQAFTQKVGLEELDLIRESCTSFTSCIPTTLVIWICLFLLSTLFYFNTKTKTFLVLITISYLVTLALMLSIHDSRERGKAWVDPVISREEYASLDWIKNNTKETEVFCSDIFGGELIMANTLRLTLEGGDWAIIPNVLERMNDANTLFTTEDSEEAWKIAVKYNCSYIWLPNRQLFMGYGWKTPLPETFKNGKFKLVFENKTQIIQVIKE